MPAHDTFHDAVKHGLIKDGWTITDDPYHDRVRRLKDSTSIWLPRS